MINAQDSELIGLVSNPVWSLCVSYLGQTFYSYSASLCRGVSKAISGIPGRLQLGYQRWNSILSSGNSYAPDGPLDSFDLTAI